MYKYIELYCINLIKELTQSTVKNEESIDVSHNVITFSQEQGVYRNDNNDTRNEKYQKMESAAEFDRNMR